VTSQQTNSEKMNRMAPRRDQEASKHDILKQGRCLAGNDQSHFSPPKAVSEYTSRKLPPLPPKPASSLSSVDDSKGSVQATLNSVHEYGSPTSLNGDSKTERGTAPSELKAFGDRDGLAVVSPPGMCIVTDLDQIDWSRSSQHQDIIHSPRPGCPGTEVLKDLETNGRFEVSPIMSPPSTGTFDYQLYEVSPLTPEDALRGGFEHIVTEPDYKERRQAAGKGQNGRRQSSWGHITTVVSQFLVTVHPVSIKETRRRSTSGAWRSQFPHSGPRSSPEAFSANTRVFQSAAHDSYLQGQLEGPRLQCDNIRTMRTNAARPGSSPAMTMPLCSLSIKGHGQAEGLGRSIGIDSLVSRAKYAGGEMISKLQFSPKESKGGKGEEELRKDARRQGA
jgi:hypothetical protein